mgnify:CR=1 FL=1
MSRTPSIRLRVAAAATAAVALVLIAAGVLTLLWALLVWQWQDPFTALYTTWRQHQLTSQYEKRVRAFDSPIAHESVAAERRSIAREARRYRLESKRGQAIFFPFMTVT